MRMFLSSAESKTFLELLEELDVKHLLFSYHYIRQSKLDVKPIFERLKQRGVEIFLDSGAHTFHHHKTNINFDEFVDDYIEFINTYKEYLYAWVELDLDKVVGYEKVLEWRKRITEKVGEPIVVWHIWREREESFVEHCQRYKYIGIANKDRKYINLNWAFFHIKKYDVKIHGFAMTNQKIIDRYPFTSVDSSSWSSGAKYGIIFLFEHGKLKGKRLKKYGKTSYGASKTLDRFNLIQWKKFAEYLKEVKI